MSTLEQVQANVRDAITNRLPLVLGNAAVNWVKDSFTQQGWRGENFEAWKAVRNQKRQGAAILIKTGRLRRSFRITKMNAASVSIGTDVPYAEVHNDGFQGQVNIKPHSRNKYGKAKASDLKTRRGKSIAYVASNVAVSGHTRNMNIPRRQFAPHDISDSPVFSNEMEAVISHEISQLFN